MECNLHQRLYSRKNFYGNILWRQDAKCHILWRKNFPKLGEIWSSTVCSMQWTTNKAGDTVANLFKLRIVYHQGILLSLGITNRCSAYVHVVDLQPMKSLQVHTFVCHISSSQIEDRILNEVLSTFFHAKLSQKGLTEE